MKKVKLFFLISLSLFIGTVVWQGIEHWSALSFMDGPKYPTDAVLEERLRNQTSEFDKLVNMSNEDLMVGAIGYDFFRVNGGPDSRDPSSEKSLSKERWDEYRHLFKEIGLQDGLDRRQDGVYLTAYNWGMVTSGSQKGYCYSLEDLKPTMESLDKVPSPIDGKILAYKKLSDHWYLYLSAD